MSEDKLAFMTVVTGDFSHYAKTWANSVRAHYPDSPIYICFADRPSAAALAQLRDFEVLIVPEISGELGLSRYRRMAFQYVPFELTCALKPFLMKYILRLEEKLIYLDADTFVYRKLNSIELMLSGSSIVLTPHLTRCADADHEKQIRGAGVFNGGFVGVSSSEPTDRFLDWWSERCRFDCYVDALSGGFVDQAWLDFVPGMFDCVAICRDDCMNVAYWNLMNRSLTRADNGDYRINNRRLGFFHFSGFDPNRPGQLSRFSDDIPGSVALDGLIEGYAEQLESNAKMFSELPCEYLTDEQGNMISAFQREAYRIQLEDLDSIEDPFAGSAVEKLAHVLEDNHERIVLSRKTWQLDELQAGANRQSEWINKHANRRIDRRIARVAKSFLNVFRRRSQTPPANRSSIGIDEKKRSA